VSAGPRSRAVFERALAALPGGVSSPVRAFGAVGGTPLVLRRGEGARVEDVDGRTYVDFVGSWGPLILGHAHPEVVAAVCDAASRGTTFGAPCEAEVDLAEEVVASYPGAEQVRFVSSGTEATMSAIRLARGVTGRDLVVKFSGCYHGHADHLLVAAGSGLVTFGRPERLDALLREEGEKIAAVIVEPIPANNGLLLQRPEFLAALRRSTERAGALLIFDEVISGFRVARGGAAERHGITPDLATFGKVIGGGLPVGAFAGRRSLMEGLAPQGGVYQAGTLSGNPVAMAAGLAALRVLRREEAWRRLEEAGRVLDERLRPVLEGSPFPARLVRCGSIFWLSLQEGEPPRSAEAIDAAAAQRYKTLFHLMLDRGVALAPSAYEVGFLSLAHGSGEIDALAAALGEALDEAARED
jgi:glutamate-1-semialdehyde 2,1-aminomutase